MRPRLPSVNSNSKMPLEPNTSSLSRASRRANTNPLSRPHRDEEWAGSYLSRSTNGFSLSLNMRLVPQKNRDFDPERQPIYFRSPAGNYGVKLRVLGDNDSTRIMDGDAKVFRGNFEKYSPCFDVRF